MELLEDFKLNTAGKHVPADVERIVNDSLRALESGVDLSPNDARYARQAIVDQLQLVYDVNKQVTYSALSAYFLGFADTFRHRNRDVESRVREESLRLSYAFAIRTGIKKGGYPTVLQKIEGGEL